MHITKNTRHFKLFLFTCFAFMFGCKDSDDNFTTVNQNLEIQDFIWKAMNEVYYWQGAVEDLADDRFDTDEDYKSFLSQFEDPKKLFQALKHSNDRFSWIVDDYVQLENALNGITKTNGMEFRLIRKSSSSDDLVGFVVYVMPHSDAANKGIERGDLFDKVNNTTLTVSNYSSLLFSEDSYSVSITTINNQNEWTPTGENITLTKSVFSENPIHKTKVLEIGGRKVAYLMYNGFLKDFDNDLETVFGDFKTANVTDLVLDLRYNSGGSVGSAIKLAGHITGQFTDQVFAKTTYNSKLADEYNGVYRFSSVSNALGLSKVYILTSKNTASASELVANGLASYIDVILVGDYTTGKNVASYTIKDIIDNNGNVNPNHKWALQPIVLKIANKDGFADFDNGLTPTTFFQENPLNLGVLGESDEPLLLEALKMMGLAGVVKPGIANETKPINFGAPLVFEKKSFRGMWIDSESGLRF